MGSDFDREFALAECGELRSMIRSYVEIVTSTERLALAGAAALAAFSVSGLTEELERARIFVSFLPAVILSLAGLRCLTFYIVLRAALSYIEEVEGEVLQSPRLGFQRRYGLRSEWINRAIEGVSGGFWVLAIGASLLFWVLANDLV